MFKISNIKKIFTYNWSNVIKNAVPKGNNVDILEGSYKDIQNGAIVSIIAAVVAQIAIVGMAISIVAKTYSAFLGSGITSYIMTGVVKESIGKWIIDIIIASIIPIATLIYINVMKKKKQNTWPYFILMILSLVLLLYMIYKSISYLSGFILSPLFAIVGLGSLFLQVLGSSSIIVGCLDFCLYANNGNNINNNMSNGYNNSQVYNNTNNINNNTYNQPMNSNPNNTMNGATFVPATGNVNSNVEQQNKFCNQCGKLISATAAFCPNCGNRIQ